jgi:hypothetical protein
MRPADFSFPLSAFALDSRLRGNDGGAAVRHSPDLPLLAARFPLSAFALDSRLRGNDAVPALDS